jgi:AP-4 complex subunit mu-1
VLFRNLDAYFLKTFLSSNRIALQLLSTIAKVFKDYCGTLSEEAIRKNFILLYELLDEMLDYGYPQVTQTANLKAFVYNEPIVVEAVPNTSQMVNPKTASASAVHKPVISSVNASGKKTNLSANQKNEIFVDILERLNILFSSNGYILNSTIDGCIQMKSYLAGNPELRLALNEDLVVGKNSQNPYGSVVLDDINFNDCVNQTEFETARTLSFVPPDGEFVVLNYRMTGEYRTPFRIFPSIEEVEAKKLEISVLIRAEMANNHFGANVSVEIPLPRCTASASCSVIGATGQSSAEFVQRDGKIIWNIKKFQGGSEQTMRAKVTLQHSITTQIRREIGPINMNFEIPMYNVSNLQVRYLRIAENMPGYTPYRWVRYVTQSNSYVCRL